MHDTRRGLEIFVRGIPSDFGPNELVPVFSKVGLIYYIRLLMDYGQCNRGIAYVSYVNSNNAHRALRVLNGLRITVDHNLELFKCRESRIFYICNIMDIFTSYSMSILITQLAHVHNFECKVSRNGNYHEAMLKFPSHRDYIRAYNKGRESPEFRNPEVSSGTIARSMVIRKI
uniref:RRM domain-containing protein n=1 Tax=Anopheles culicifacies TaxID=139723 RepID=A0A182M470_9DIPT